MTLKHHRQRSHQDSCTLHVIGHRGAAGMAIENSEEALKAGVQSGAWGIEVDLRQTKDKQFVVCHDANLKRSLGIDQKISQATLSELQSINTSNNSKLLSAEELRQFHSQHAPTSTLILEFKGTRWAHAATKLLSNWPEDQLEQVVVASFNTRDLRELQQKVTRARYVYHFHGIPTGLHLLSAKKYGAWGIGMSNHYVNRLTVATARRLGIETVVFTVNSTRRAKRLARIGVFGIFTDFPDRILSGLAKSNQ